MNSTQHKSFAVNALGVDAKMYEEMNAANQAKNAMIRKVRDASMEELDAILERTEYCESGVALGGAAEDQDLRRLAQRELASRLGLAD
jgi:hypothetical protein